MRKTITLAALWTYTGWTAGSAAVMFYALPDLVGPLAGLAALFAYLAMTAPRSAAQQMPRWAASPKSSSGDLALDGNLSR